MIIQSATVSPFGVYQDYYPEWVLWIANKLNIKIDRNTKYDLQAAVTVSKEGIENYIPLAGYVFYVATLKMYCIMAREDTMILWTVNATDKILTDEDFVGQSMICLYQAREEPKTSAIKVIASAASSMLLFRRDQYIPRYMQIILGISAWFNLGVLIRSLYKLMC